MIATAERLNGIGEYYFSTKLREIDEMNKSGEPVINLGIGSPDLAPHPDVIKVLHEESAKPNVHAYQSYKGSPVFRQAVATWYKQFYNVDLNTDSEILPLIGSKEGIMHICMTYLDAGDKVLIPDPGYPTYRSAVKLAGGDPVQYLLTEKNNWFPDLGAVENTVDNIRKQGGVVKLMFVNYPHMPTGQLPDQSKMEALVQFAKTQDILLVHDNPYSFILNDSPASLLSVPGALDVVLELNSLSKSHNMAGWRLGVLCAKKERIDEVLRFKSNMDSGMFLPVQLAAAKALSLGKDWYENLNIIYRRRREIVYRILDLIGCKYDKSQAGMFVWAPIPDRYKDGYELSDKILYNSRVFLTPGGIFGEAGNRYIRVSLCTKEEKLEEALKKIEALIKGEEKATA
jgi:LL-diaminopimelate aminotransferase